MRYKATFVAGLATGYVLGARAGREHYETIRRAGQKLVQSQRVQGAAGAVQTQASGYAEAARRKIGDHVPEKLRPHEHAADTGYAHDGHAAR